jgi:hypothetical protein
MIDRTGLLVQLVFSFVYDTHGVRIEDARTWAHPEVVTQVEQGIPVRSFVADKNGPSCAGDQKEAISSLFTQLPRRGLLGNSTPVSEKEPGLLDPGPSVSER